MQERLTVWQEAQDPRRSMRRFRGVYVGSFYWHLRKSSPLILRRIWTGGRAKKRRRTLRRPTKII
jgi:hypothetical protein